MLKMLQRALSARHGSGHGEAPQAPPTPTAGGQVEQQLGKLACGMIEGAVGNRPHLLRLMSC